MNDFPQGSVHQAGEDLEAAVRMDPIVPGLWGSLTPLGRNEFICWVQSAKQATPHCANLLGAS
ncbi:Bacteriocin-protection, YdeI or OmpD-Associated [Devosia psychrophila]|uniref:Bacteriocin-protection, YdeI or OmpD-Associated n=1 Tax=Devosia psychrophila TaxID=728005 RepID=A0A1I1NXJ5_9HYPH|nr:Bacteriocin-protection, YdeI or OmpD-Associated [Devosia psychrophila]